MKIEVLDALVAAGCTAEQIAAAVKASGAARTLRQARNARYYDRKASEKRLNKTESDVCKTIKTNSDATAPLPDKEIPPIPPKENNPSPSSLRSEEKKRATRLQLDWALPASWGKWAIAEGHSEATIRIEADKFRDFWHSKAGTDAKKMDWLATWRNWMRNAPGRFQERSPPKSAVAERQEAALKAFNYNHRTTDYEQFTGDIIDLESGNFRSH